MLFHEIVESIAIEKPNKVALYYLGKKFTYKHFVDKFQRFASALVDLQVKAGERVGIYSYLHKEL